MTMRPRRLWPDGIIFSSGIVCVDDLCAWLWLSGCLCAAWVSYCNDSFGWFFWVSY